VLQTFGGGRMFAVIVAVQLALGGLMLLDFRLPVLTVLAVAVVVVALKWPLGAVAGLLAARIIGTASMSWMRIGSINLGLFEPVLALCLVALVYHAMVRRQSVLHTWPWRGPFLAFMGWQALGLFWCTQLGQGLQEFIASGIILVNCTLILTFVRSVEDYQKVFYAWIGASVMVGVLSMFTDLTGVGSSGSSWEIAAGGGRETGLGQQPNWFAMNLMFSVHTCFGFAVVTRKRALRWLLIAAGLYIFISQLRSGSRGGAYSLVIGGALVALAHPLFRRWMIRFAAVAAALFFFYVVIDGGSSTSKAFTRIAMNVTNTWGSDVRELNWFASIQMFGDTWGRGIGPGGYPEMLADYSWKLYTSIHRYPHGIFWGLVAHYGVIGLAVAGWLLWSVFQMARDLVVRTKGTAVEIFAWTMPATMLGYIAWSFVEFSWDDKPFWEFLSVYTALYLAVCRGAELPSLRAGVRLPWNREPVPDGPTVEPA